MITPASEDTVDISALGLLNEVSTYNEQDVAALKTFLLQADDDEVTNADKLECDANYPFTWDFLSWSEDETDKRAESIDLGGELVGELNLTACTELQYLGIYDSQITSVNVSGCEKLTQLYCWHNKIEELNVSGCTGLTEFDCYDCTITNLDASGCTGLTYFYCRGFNSTITNLDLSGCTGLENITIHDSSLESLNVSGCTKLTVLYCSDNLLSELDVSQNTRLQALFCSGNALKELDLSNNIELKELSCDDNALEELNLSNNPRIWWLDCSDNSLTSLDVSMITQLERMFCSGNELTELILPENPWFRYLDCSHNPLESLDLTDCRYLSYLYCEGISVTDLDLSQNARLGKLSCGGGDLETVKLSQTSINYTYISFGEGSVWTIKDAQEKETVIDGEENRSYMPEADAFPFTATNEDETQIITFSLGEAVEYFENDVTKLRTFFEQEDTAQVKNGEKLFGENYDADDPTTWNCVSWVMVDGKLRFAAFYTEEHNLAGPIDFSGMANLFEFYFRDKNAEISSADFSGCTTLQELGLEITALETLTLADCASLDDLGIYGTLTSLDVSDCADLSYLNCTGYTFTDLDLSKNEKLKTIRFETYAITNVTLPLTAVSNQLYVSIADAEKSGWAVKIGEETTPIMYGYTVTTVPFSLVNLNTEHEVFFNTLTALTGLTLSSTTPTVGDTLTATIAPEGATVTYQWFRGTEIITGATTNSYTTSASDAGCVIKCEATGTDAYAGTVSAVTEAVQKIALTGLTLSSTTPTVGDTLTATVAPEGATVTYQWFRGTEIITGATSNSYTTSASDAGCVIKCEATGTGEYGGTVSAVTNEVEKAKLATPDVDTYIEGKTVSVNWNQVPNAETYTVEYSVAGAAKWTVKKNIKSQNFSFTAKAGYTYDVRVKAVPGKNSTYVESEAAEVSVDCAKMLGTLKLKATYQGDDNATVSVTGVSSDATQLWVVLGTEKVLVSLDGTEAVLGTVKCSYQNNTLTFTNLQSNSKYSFEVQQVITEAGKVTVASAVAKVAIKTTKACYNTPQDVKATVVSDTQVTVSWSPVTGKGSTQQAAAYTVQYSIAGTNKWKSATTKATGDSWVVSKLKGDTSYEFRVCATKDKLFIASAYSESASATTMRTAPKITAVTSKTAGTAVLTWKADATATKYEIQYRVKGTSNWSAPVEVEPVAGAKKMTYTITDLTSQQSYEFQIRSIDAELSASAWSASKVLSKVK